MISGVNGRREVVWEVGDEQWRNAIVYSARTVAAAKAFRIMEAVGYFLFLFFFGGFLKFSPGIL